MATLPVSLLQIITPHGLHPEERADVVGEAANRPRVTPLGGTRYALNLSLAPINIVHDPATYNELRTFLAKHPLFSVPLESLGPGSATGVWTVSGPHLVGATDITVTGTGSMKPGQLLQFGIKEKVYEVEDSAANVITLAQPLRQNLSDGDAITYTATTAKGEAFTGVLGLFEHLDYGNPFHTVDGGVVARFGPLRLAESIT